MIKLFETFGLKFSSHKRRFSTSDSYCYVYKLPIRENASLKAQYNFKDFPPENFRKDFAIIDEYDNGKHNVYFGVGCRASGIEYQNYAERIDLYGSDLDRAIPAYSSSEYKDKNDKIVAFDNFVKAILDMPKILDDSECKDFKDVVEKIKTPEKDADSKKGGVMKRVANLCENGIYPLLLLLAMDEKKIDLPRKKEIFTLFATDKGFQEDFINFSKALVIKPKESGIFSKLTFAKQPPKEYFVISQDQIRGHLARAQRCFNILLKEVEEDANNISKFIYDDLSQIYREKSILTASLVVAVGDQKVDSTPQPQLQAQPFSQSSEPSSEQQQSNAPTKSPESVAATLSPLLGNGLRRL